MKKKSLTLVLALVAFVTVVGSLTGCSPSPADAPTTVSSNEELKVKEFTLTLEDGSTVQCVYISEGSGKFKTGGPSCDWASQSAVKE